MSITKITSCIITPMSKLKNDIRDATLSNKAILKSDRDIETIKSLNKFAKRSGNILVLSGGYAVEAHCGGKITRAHGDIDAHFILTGKVPNDQLLVQAQELLDEENTKWKVKQRIPDKLDYIEDDENKEFFDKRHVEVRLNTPHKNNIKYPKRTLINSRGKIVEIVIVDLNQIISEKINKIFETKDRVNTSIDRHPSATDYLDLKRLLDLKEYDKERVLKSVSQSTFGVVMKLLHK